MLKLSFLKINSNKKGQISDLVTSTSYSRDKQISLRWIDKKKQLPANNSFLSQMKFQTKINRCIKGKKGRKDFHLIFILSILHNHNSETNINNLLAEW